MPGDVRSRARLLVSTLSGIVFTFTWIILTAYLTARLNDALVGYPNVSKGRIVIVAILVLICVFWGVIGITWLVEDCNDWAKGNYETKPRTRRTFWSTDRS
jgi:hypothetical protein